MALERYRDKNGRKRALLFGLVAISASAAVVCPNKPRAWSTLDGHSADQIQYQQDIAVCRGSASYASGIADSWIVRLIGCMKVRGYRPVYNGIFC